MSPTDHQGLLDRWQAAWAPALGCWSVMVRLSPPRWCLNIEDEDREGLSGSFAMIRLIDHAVVVSLRQAADMGVGDFALEVLAHEVGHHVLAPADLTDNARLLARTRAGLPSREQHAPYIANLYADLLINDRLTRSAGLNMAAVFRTLNARARASDAPPGRLWSLYSLICEHLWRLPPGDLAGPEAHADDRLRVDADLGARLIRAYGRDWLDGAGRFAVLCLEHLLADTPKMHSPSLPPWLDAIRAGEGGRAPQGLTDLEADEIHAPPHPAEDDELTGLTPADKDETAEAAGNGAGQTGRGEGEAGPRPPGQYTELLHSLGVTLPENELIRRYYRELAAPHLAPFPHRRAPKAEDPLPEGLEEWDPTSPLADLDWMESLLRSPWLLPGVTTVRRSYGREAGPEPATLPLDLYVGVDCSGSMSNPKVQLSYPVLAATIVALSGLRAGARVMACLSGEHPGSPQNSRHSQTQGFIRDENAVLATLTGYLGTGSAFGIGRLQAAFLDPDCPHDPQRAAHILVITDLDIFHMLGHTADGWDIAARSVNAAGGGGAMLLHAPAGAQPENTARLEELGFNVHFVRQWPDVVAFARAFSRARFGDAGPGARR